MRHSVESFQLPSSGCQHVTLRTHSALSALQVFPVRMLLIADNGINIVENYNLETGRGASATSSCWWCHPRIRRHRLGAALFALVSKD